MVSTLMTATESWLGEGQYVVAAALSSSDRITLTIDEVNDVFD